MLTRLRQQFAAYVRRKAMLRVRRHLAALGLPAHLFSDDEIEQGAVALGKAARKSGVSAADAAEALRRLGKSGL